MMNSSLSLFSHSGNQKDEIDDFQVSPWLRKKLLIVDILLFEIQEIIKMLPDYYKERSSAAEKLSPKITTSTTETSTENSDKESNKSLKQDSKSVTNPKTWYPGALQKGTLDVSHEKG